MNCFIRCIAKRFKRSSFVYRICYSIYSFPLRWFSKYGYIYNYFFFPIMGFFRKNHIWPFFDSNLDKIEKMKGIYNNRRCFIIATGPSLTVEDIKKLENEITIGVNSLYRLYDNTDFRPTYYICLDLDIQKNVMNYMSNHRDICKEIIFFNASCKMTCEKVRYIHVCYQNHWFKIYDPEYSHSDNLNYHTDLVYGIYDKYTIVNAAIEVAIYMGFSEIYLLGVDCNYKGKNTYAFKPEDNHPIIDDRKKDLTHKAMIEAYNYMEKETKRHNIKIYNATRGGMLEEFERISLEDIFKEYHYSFIKGGGK